MKIVKCVMWKEGRCNSLYNKGDKCDGIHPPAKCPFDFKKDESDKSKN